MSENTRNERFDEQKAIIDRFYAEKQEIGKVDVNGNVQLSVDDAYLITETFAFQEAKLLKAKLFGLSEDKLNERGVARRRRNDYLLANTISHIVNAKLDSNQAKDPDYTPTLAEQLALVGFVGAMLYKKSLKDYTPSADEQEEE